MNGLESVHVLFGHFDVNSRVCSHRTSRPNGLHGLRGSARNNDDFLGDLFLLESHRFFHAYFIERIHGVLDTLRYDALFVGLYTNVYRIIDYPLTSDHYPHFAMPKLKCFPSIFSINNIKPKDQSSATFIFYVQSQILFTSNIPVDLLTKWRPRRTEDRSEIVSWPYELIGRFQPFI